MSKICWMSGKHVHLHQNQHSVIWVPTEPCSGRLLTSVFGKDVAAVMILIEEDDQYTIESNISGINSSAFLFFQYLRKGLGSRKSVPSGYPIYCSQSLRWTGYRMPCNFLCLKWVYSKRKEFALRANFPFRVDPFSKGSWWNNNESVIFPWKCIQSP